MVAGQDFPLGVWWNLKAVLGVGSERSSVKPLAPLHSSNLEECSGMGIDRSGVRCCLRAVERGGVRLRSAKRALEIRFLLCFFNRPQGPNF